MYLSGSFMTTLAIIPLALIFVFFGCGSPNSNISIVENENGEPLGKGLKYWQDCSISETKRVKNYNRVSEKWCIYKIVSDDFCLQVWYKEECD